MQTLYNMRIILQLLLSVLFTVNIIAQKVDYLQMRDTLAIKGCGTAPLDQVIAAKEKLLRVYTSEISENLYQYYRDIANCYYRIWGNKMREEDAKEAIYYNQLVFQNNPNFYAAYWDILLIYYMIGDCEQGDKYLKLFQQNAPESEWNLDEVQLLQDSCKKTKEK